MRPWRKKNAEDYFNGVDAYRYNASEGMLYISKGLPQDSNEMRIKIDTIRLNSSSINSTLDSLSADQLENATGFTLEQTAYGKINYTNGVNLSGIADFGTAINISENHIEINSSALGALNTSARLTIYGLSFSNPRILKNRQACSDCTIVNYSAGSLTFDVSGFSSYSAEETPASPASSQGGDCWKKVSISSPSSLEAVAWQEALVNVSVRNEGCALSWAEAGIDAPSGWQANYSRKNRLEKNEEWTFALGLTPPVSSAGTTWVASVRVDAGSLHSARELLVSVLAAHAPDSNESGIAANATENPESQSSLPATNESAIDAGASANASGQQPVEAAQEPSAPSGAVGEGKAGVGAAAQQENKSAVAAQSGWQSGGWMLFAIAGALLLAAAVAGVAVAFFFLTRKKKGL